MSKRLKILELCEFSAGGCGVFARVKRESSLLRKLGYKVAEVPVEWFEFNERREVSPIKDSWEGFRDLVRVRINALKGVYK